MRYEAKLLDGPLKDRRILIVGNSYSLKRLDLNLAKPLPTIGCNRTLKDGGFWPQFLMISDREVYCQERNEGRLADYATGDYETLLLSDTIFDHKIKGKRADMDVKRQRGPQPEPDFNWYSWRVGAWFTHLNFETFAEQMCSFGNIAGPMLQAAVIMGAKEIGMIGIDMAWPKKGPSHFWGDGKKLGAFPFVSLQMTMRTFQRAKEELAVRGVSLHNLSPVKGTPMSKVFGNESYGEFVKGGSNV